jgi:hypothetical protein
MALINRVKDVCSYIDVTDDFDPEKTMRVPRSSIWAWAKKHSDDNPVIDRERDAETLRNIDVSGFDGEIVYA